MAIVNGNKTLVDAIVTEKRTAIVDFSADYCSPCKVMLPILDKLSEAYDSKVEVVKIDIIKNKELAMEYGIMSIPTLFIFKDGEVEDTIYGFHGREQLEEIFEGLVK